MSIRRARRGQVPALAVSIVRLARAAVLAGELAGHVTVTALTIDENRAHHVEIRRGGMLMRGGAVLFATQSQTAR